ncbi:hypothetical protein BL250_14940 [Erwinia sp. OLTSP20]|uniref:hypothetical protein n=1 Tax=unclassified Erwinia TaxID=2622719 RepID=UPI000C17AECF|nr:MULTISPECIES: hypothetical protein [unclassified Erwinia]PIJ48287.1 hypothetical protein BV501_17670 [Erwinia sp. OAMSP11]PIJ68873.1 hypothetical protein BK416_15935 [Erwinia sp. OLSSP12]PIJ80093.1 hypothetical protein BLD46_16120 [Erwinia sp. OLMTSP26]PIJ81536.1 hypothetical protein BLD49_16365 [Erwinia sp. OLMDSP33]PIJ82704.1 hypothetical protein BLD47_06275 [Erwinia sp. OLCASP19]
MKSPRFLIFVLLVSSSLAGCQSMSRTHTVDKTSEVPSANAATAPSDDTSPGNSSKASPSSQQIEAESAKGNGADNSDETIKLERCKAQLEALRTLAPEKYSQLNNAFRYIMRGAASYASIRSETTRETQDTIDALYHYRSNLICSQIGQTMMNSLSLHGAMP